MKTHTSIDKFVVKQRMYTSVNVCMHVMGKALTDYRVMRSATALVDAGCSVSIIDSPGDSSQLAEEESQSVRVKHIMVPRRFMNLTLASSVKSLIKFVQATLLLLRTPADVYHAHDVTALPACYIAAQLRRKPLIYDAHELPSAALEHISPYWLRAWLERLLKWLILRCTAVITVSPPIVEVIRNSYHIAEVSLLRNVPLYRYTPKGDRLREKLGLPSGVHIALYQGNLQPDRELDRLIAAAPFLEEGIVIVLMGRGIGETEQQLNRLIACKGVADRVKILPPVPYAELLEWTASADIGLIVYGPERSLNVQMCLPNKLFEYLMAGLPVLASPLDAVSALITTYDIGKIVPELTPAAVGTAVNMLLADHVAYARMRRNALEVARHELCWEKESRHLIQLYHSLIAARGR